MNVRIILIGSLSCSLWPVKGEHNPTSIDDWAEDNGRIMVRFSLFSSRTDAREQVARACTSFLVLIIQESLLGDTT
jgi:hypothetical protein